MKRLSVPVFLLIASLAVSGCATVKAYEKEHLTDPIMVSAAETREELRELKWLEAREGSMGGVGGAGGGCACK